MFADWVIFIIVLIVGSVVGMFFDYGMAGAFLALMAWNIWQIESARRINHYLKTGEQPSPFFLLPSLDEIYVRIKHLHQRSTPDKSFTQQHNVLGGFQDAPFGMILLNSTDRIQAFNDKGREFLGLKSSDLNIAVNHLFRTPQILSVLQRKEPTTLEWTSNRGKVYLVSIGHWGEGHLLLMQDQTALFEAEHARGTLLGNTSHELRTPLTIIQGYAEMMASSEHGKAMQEPINEILQQAKHMEKIIAEMLTLVRLEKKTLSKEELGVVKMPRFVADLVKSSQLSIREKKCHLSTEIDSTVQIYGKRDELWSAFSNLIQNAIFFSKKDGAIILRWYVDESGGHFEVVDFGCGIAAQHIPHITERLYRVNQSGVSSKETSGTGLGLAIVKHVLRRHHAQLYIQSALGKGSLFRCDFPKHMLCYNNTTSQSDQ